jgi:hypothetical protein
LYTWKDTPLAFYDVPTLNDMVFPLALWEKLLENPYIKAALESKSHWGEAFHADSDEMKIPQVCIRVNNFYPTENNLIVGDVDLMDTPNGLIAYALAKTGRIGNSSRGYGELLPMRGSQLKEVSVPDYVHIGWDAVAFPAVPNCHMSLAEEASLATTELGSLTEELKRMVRSAVDRFPEDGRLLEMYGLLSGKTYNDTSEYYKKLMIARAREREAVRDVLLVQDVRRRKRSV